MRPGRGVRFFLAASVPLITIAAGWLALHSSATTIETDRAERREVVLNDGSVVNLEPETVLRVDLGKVQRYVVLTRGRALFHVAKNPARPFIVHAGDTNVRAVGTIFGVEQKNQNIIVTVSEGKVSVGPSVALSAPERLNSPENPHPQPLSSHAERGVRQALSLSKLGERGAVAQREGEASSPPDSGKGDSGDGITSGQPGEVFLTANQQITVRKSGDATAVQRVDSSRALAWSEGRLVFDSTPLSDVVDEFNRYNRVQLHIDSPELARRTVSGVFRASDPETLIDFIGAGAHVVVTRQGNSVIVISPRP
jgi:transmembrane sensor